MARLTQQIIDKIQEAAEKISYGSINIILIDNLNTVDIEVNERIRLEKGNVHRPGEIVNKKINNQILHQG
jgi:hypothetical protein